MVHLPVGYSSSLGRESFFPFFSLSLPFFYFTSVSTFILFLPFSFLYHYFSISSFLPFSFLPFQYYLDTSSLVPLYLSLIPTHYVSPLNFSVTELFIVLISFLP
jgi:hypothetical protein